MQLNRWNYYSDFIVYPALVLALACLALYVTPVAEWWRRALEFSAGIVVWTFAEYILHRFVLHRVPWARDMHEAHHRDQHALIGTSTFVSAPIYLALILPPLWLIGGPASACALTAGFLAGYLWYVSVHHLVHHRPARRGSAFFALKRRHALHHHIAPEGNFGVTSGFWDRILGTEIRLRERRGDQALSAGADALRQQRTGP